MGLSQAEIGRRAGVDPAQVSRICAGRFRTISHNVMQICIVLGLEVTPGAAPGGSDDGWALVQSSMRRLWNETPEGARAIARLLDAVVDLRNADPPTRAPPD